MKRSLLLFALRSSAIYPQGSALGDSFVAVLVRPVVSPICSVVVFLFYFYSYLISSSYLTELMKFIP